MSDQIECCPFEDCRSARFRANSMSHVGRDAEANYRCKDCKRPFDEPDERDRHPAGGGRHGLAGKLADPDVSEPADLRADGGQPHQDDYSDDVVLDAEHATAPKDENGDPVGIADDTPDLPDPEDCDHDRTATATDHDDAPTGTEICIDCGTEVPTDA